VSEYRPSRRTILKGAGGLTVAAGLSAGTILATSSAASAADDGHGLHIVNRGETDPRMWFYRFQTAELSYEPSVNVLLPDDYHTSGRTYPVLYLLHGGLQDFITFDRHGVREWTAGKPIVVVMPDGGKAGWYSNPVSSNAGPRNYETFHLNQLLPWIEENFRVYADPAGRAVSGFSMGGFGALKYAAKYFGHFGSVSSHSGPASIRRDGGLVANWANASSAAVELNLGTIYGVPWDEARVTADNAMENIERYRGKRIFLVAGTSPGGDPMNYIQESQVLAGHREFRAALDAAGIPHGFREEPGGHEIRGDMFVQDIEGMVAHLRKAG